MGKDVSVSAIRFFFLPGSVSAVWLEAGFWTELWSPPAAGEWARLRGQGSPPGHPLSSCHSTLPEWTRWVRGAGWGPQWLVSAVGRWPVHKGTVVSLPWSLFNLKKKNKHKYKKEVTLLTWNCSAAFWPAVAAVAFGTEPPPWPGVGPRNRGARVGRSRGGSWEARLCSCWTSWSFCRSSCGDTTPCICEDRPDKTKMVNVTENELRSRGK